VLTDREVEWDKEHGTPRRDGSGGDVQEGRRLGRTTTSCSRPSQSARHVHYKPQGDEFHRERLTKELPREPLAIKPHPYGVELGC